MTNDAEFSAMQRARLLVALTAEKRQLEARLREVVEAIAAQQEPLLEFLADSGVARLTVDGYTIFPYSQTWASAQDGDMQRACDALIAAGLGDMCALRFNAQTLSAWVREELRAGRDLPAEFASAIKVSTTVEIRARRAENGG